MHLPIPSIYILNEYWSIVICQIFCSSKPSKSIICLTLMNFHVLVQKEKVFDPPWRHKILSQYNFIKFLVIDILCAWFLPGNQICIFSGKPMFLTFWLGNLVMTIPFISFMFPGITARIPFLSGQFLRLLIPVDMNSNYECIGSLLALFSEIDEWI